ncbi:MAG: DNA polymerase III subunit beta [Solirubrobacteraceae bacterium]
MKFIVSSSELLKSIQIVNGVIVSNNTLPILDNFLVELKNNNLAITSSDLETTITTNCEVESESENKFTVSSKLLTEIVRSFPEQPLTFKQINETQLEIITEQGKYFISFDKADEYPSTPSISDGEAIEIKGYHLLEAIKNTSFATGNDNLRPVMTGVFFQISEEGFKFVATDAHRLVKYSRSDLKANKSAEFIVPKKSLNILKNIFSTIGDIVITLEYNTTNIKFSFGSTIIISRLIDGKYPNYEAVIPKENPNLLQINRELILNSLKRVSIFSNKTSQLIRIKLVGNSILLNAEDIDYANKAEEKLPCSYSGSDIEIGFNARFLREMISNIQTEDISLELSHPSRAGILRPIGGAEEGEDLLMLMMPLILN